MSTKNWIKSNWSLALLLTLTVYLGACNPNPQPTALTPIPTLAPGATVTLAPALLRPVESTSVPISLAPGEGDAALGAPLFLFHCSPCHGVQGQGIDAPPLRNSHYVQKATEEEIAAVISDGRTGTEMPAWLQAQGGPLMAADIVRVIAYLHTLQGVPPLPTSTPMPVEPTETPLPPNAPTPEPAQPSLPGGPGPAASLAGDAVRGKAAFGTFCAVCHSAEGVGGVPNPGSDDGTVPELNPIDSTIANPNSKAFANNVDLFLEHGSVPEGPNPMIMMPSFGDGKMLTDQELADLIAYLIFLNPAEK